MDRWITTSEAAERLGVKRGTLYSYVSRGVLHSRRMPGQAESLFDRTQVDSLAAAKHDGRREADRLLRFRAVTTRVSALRGDSLRLRGRPIARVCAEMGFAAAARFVLEADAAVPPPVVDLAAARAVVLERRIPLAVALLAAHDPLRADRSAVAERTLGLLPVLAELVPEVRLEHPWVQAQSTCLIDNGLAASTTAARVAASSRAGLYDALLAGYGAMAGVLHGGAPAAAYAMLGRVLEGGDVDAAIADASWGGHLAGFGHIVYTGEDPRATVVLGMMRAELPDAPALQAVSVLAERVGRAVNIDLAGAAVAHALGLPARATEVLFQYGRTVGMAAHIAEEYEESPLRWRGANSGGVR
ncbi:MULTISPECIES: citrate/2-methylcitrate synthase [Tsukamurella]|uniref:citrate synthase (unknown stereospecificity) n=2 Tax=Tsukamurella TaxID=2060 RepID=A0A5C5RZX4_9ACTN|nr:MULTISPECIES: citrate/2-methylcitrate synthase [Tsukamurella]NMD58249.1 excisionase family DNA-binding protein [Tsukamurella columbiensis]TWS28689.1 helix-turn-helix domain-containing protein [Tsukamurella conjunctivitidis]